MIQLAPQMRILVAVEPADFRRGIDGIAALCRAALACDPMSGTVYVFRNRRATAVKLLVYDGQGFWLCHKRMSAGRFRCWPQGTSSRTTAVEAYELQVLLFGGDPQGTKAAPMWRRVGPQPD